MNFRRIIDFQAHLILFFLAAGHFEQGAVLENQVRHPVTMIPIFKETVERNRKLFRQLLFRSFKRDVTKTVLHGKIVHKGPEIFFRYLRTDIAFQSVCLEQQHFPFQAGIVKGSFQTVAAKILICPLLVVDKPISRHGNAYIAGF